MDVAVATGAEETVVTEEDHEEAVDQAITIQEAVTMVENVKETVKGTIRTMIVIKAMANGTEWTVVLTRVVNAPTRTTMEEVATRVTMAKGTSKVLTDPLVIEEVHPMDHEEEVEEVIVEVHHVELQEDPLEELEIVEAMIATRITQKNKRLYGQSQNRPVLICSEIEVQMPAFFTNTSLTPVILTVKQAFAI